VTPNPQDMFNIIHAQLEVAREKLPLEYTKEVAIACLQVLQSVQRDAYANLANNWKDMESETMCALINDNQCMRDKCDEFGQHVLRFVQEGDDKDVIREILVTVSEEYVRIAVMAVNSLAKYVFGRLIYCALRLCVSIRAAIQSRPCMRCYDAELTSHSTFSPCAYFDRPRIFFCPSPQ
jgi:hypothetical protein